MTDIDHIQFVAHQYKIPAKLDLYVASSDLHFHALGSLQFSENAHTNFTAREFKSVLMNGIKAQYLKISIPGCHSNVHNSRHQAGLVTLNIIGKSNVSYTMGNRLLRPPEAEESASQMLEAIEAQKREAVKHEDFRLAEALKRRIESIKRSFDKIDALTRQKAEAVKMEDYESAAKMKQEMDFLMGADANAGMIPDKEPRAPAEPRAPRPGTGPQVERQAPQRISEPSPRRPAPGLAMAEVLPSLEDGGIDRDVPPRRQAAPVGPPRAVVPSVDDEIPVGQARPQRAHLNNDSMQTEAEELSPAKQQEAGILIDLFGIAPIACFFSKAWNLRVDGIKKLAGLIEGLKSDQFSAYMRFCSIMKHRLKETHKVVFQTAVEALKSTGKALKLNTGDLARCVTVALPFILAKLGCAQKNLSDVAFDFILWLADEKEWELVTPILTNPLKNQAQFKIALAQLELLKALILKVGSIVGIPGLNIPLLMGFVIPCVESAKPEVRTAAVEIIVLADALHGSTIYQYFEKFRPTVKDLVMEAIRVSKNLGGADNGKKDKTDNAAKENKAKHIGNEKSQTTA
jgi:hypothetical protein